MTQLNVFVIFFLIGLPYKLSFTKCICYDINGNQILYQVDIYQLNLITHNSYQMVYLSDYKGGKQIVSLTLRSDRIRQNLFILMRKWHQIRRKVNIISFFSVIIYLVIWFIIWLVIFNKNQTKQSSIVLSFNQLACWFNKMVYNV